MRRTFVSSLLALAFAVGCQDIDRITTQISVPPKAAPMTQEVVIKVGEMGPDFAKRYPEKVRIQHQPAGVDFYDMDWDARPRAIVRVEHGKNSFVIQEVLGLMATQELGELKAEGLKKFILYVGLSTSSPGLIPHDEARLKTHAILRQMLDAGWKPTVPRSRPRLKGQDRLDYVLNVSTSIQLDPGHLPSFEEWMRIETRTSWGFYANGLYMDVSFTREPTLTDPDEPGSYLLTFNIQTETEYFRGFAGPDNRLGWKEVLPQELAKLAALRAEKEAELRAKGIPIDESYQDPPVPALK